MAQEEEPDSPPPAAPSVVPLEARAQFFASGQASVKATAKTAKARPRARTKVGRAVLNNVAEIELIGLSFIALVNARIESLQQERPNSDEAKAARDRAIADCEDLKQKVQAFLGAASDFSTKNAKERSVVSATASFAEGVGNWWSKEHMRICNQALPVALFAIGVSICTLAGADGVLSTAITGVLAGGKPVADVIKAYLKHDRG
jgi:hypothetical protein